MLLLPAGHRAARERHPLFLRPPLSGEYVISKSTSSFIHIYFGFHVVNTCMLVDSSSPTLSFFFLLQSKHKEDAFATHLILLDEPEFEVQLFPFIFLYIPFAMCLQPCPFSFLLVTVSFVPHSSSLLSSSKMSPS